MTPTTQTMPSSWRRFVALACCWLAAVLSVSAQTTGSIQGRVYNPATKQYVNNAEIRLQGSNQVVYSAQDGSFSLMDVPAGPATITIVYSGYDTVTESFNVTAGQPAVREINVQATTLPSAIGKDGTVKLEAFTVSSQREGNSKAIAAQRKDMNIITAVSSDIFGEVMDGNVGEFLKYLPGVDLEYVESEPRGPRLGGMDTQYVGVAMDGMRTANADANRGGGAASRATSFEGFSITSVESIEINRTASPENDADSVAGSINMKTKRAFDRKGRAFSYSYSVNMNGEEFTLKKQPGIQDGVDNWKSYKWMPNWSADYAESFLNERFGILLSASHGASYTEQLSQTINYNRGVETAATVGPGTTLNRPIDTRPMVIRSVSFGDGPKFIIKDALLLTADWKATPRLVLSTNMSYSYFEGHFWNRSFDMTLANDNQNALNGRGTVGGDGILTLVAPRNTGAATGAVNGTVLNNGVAAIGNGGGSSAKLTYSRQFGERFEYKNGRWTLDGFLAWARSQNNYESIERGFINSEGGSMPAGFVMTRPNAQSWEWTVRQTEGADWTDLRNYSDTNTRSGGTRVNNDNRTWFTTKWTAAVNARWVMPWLEKFPTVMKFGAKWDAENRYNRTDSDMDIWSYIGPGGNTVTRNATTGVYTNTAFGNWANVGPQYISPLPFGDGTTNSVHFIGLNGQEKTPPRVSRSEVANLFHAHPELFVNTSTPENLYTKEYANPRRFVQTINAGYWQADTRITNKLTLRYGARVEQTLGKYRERDPLTRAQLLALNVPLNAPGTNNGRPTTFEGMRTMFETNPMVTRRGSYTDFFPSAVFKYQITKDLEWQAGGNKGISRPGVDDVTGLWVINDNGLTVSTPNANLLPEYLKSYQTRLAYYFGGRSNGQLTAQFNMVETKNFIQTVTMTAAQFGVDDPDFTNYTFNVRSNVPGLQRYKNMELNYQQTLGFLQSEYLRGINVGATYTRSYANQIRNNLAPHRWTGRFGYNYRRFGSNISFIWVDDRPIDGVNYRYWGAMTKWDGSLTWKLSNYATAFLQVRNPTNQKDLRYETPPGAAKGVGKHLRHMEEYGDNWIFGVRGRF
ncbi:MAG: TonB-dependent receptor [Verrucomicrobia bacterium]|nr:TonB-dependent receptor [Verrucomicrobiota bacterium]